MRRHGYDRQGDRPLLRRRLDRWFGAEPVSVRCGARHQGSNESWPLGARAGHRYSGWLHAHGTPLIDVWIQRTDVVEVLRVPSLIGSGFVFRTMSGDADDVIVWAGPPASLSSGCSVGRFADEGALTAEAGR